MHVLEWLAVPVFGIAAIYGICAVIGWIVDGENHD